jgi:hypothetical protein
LAARCSACPREGASGSVSPPVACGQGPSVAARSVTVTLAGWGTACVALATADASCPGNCRSLGRRTGSPPCTTSPLNYQPRKATKARGHLPLGSAGPAVGPVREPGGSHHSRVNGSLLNRARWAASASSGVEVG